MTAFVPCKKNDSNGYTFYLSLAPQVPNGAWQANPTLAAGDVKIAKDDGAPADLATLPVVDADFTKRVKVVLSQGETNADNISIIFSDAAGAEWCDATISIQTVARQIDDLASSAALATAQTGIDDLPTNAELATALAAADDAVLTQVALVKAKTDTLPGDPADASDISGAFGAVNATLATLATIDARLDTEIPAIKAKTDLIPAAPAAVSDIPTAIQNADALLNRDLATGTDSGSPTVRTVRQALRFLRNKWTIAAGVLTVFKEDDSTASWSGLVATDAAADPVISSDPAGP